MNHVTFFLAVFICDLCGKRLKCKTSMLGHLKFKHIGIERKSVMRKPKKKTCKCSVCETRLTSDELNQHLCGTDETIICEYCNTSFSSIPKILEHLQISHDEKKLYRCEKCPRFFAMIRLKEYHLSRHNGESKSFICNICTKGFATSTLLGIHQQRHTTEKCNLFFVCNAYYYLENINSITFFVDFVCSSSMR